MSDTPSSSRGYWESIAQRGVWAGYYDRAPDERTYNFFTRRRCVMRLLEGDQGYSRVLDVGCGTADYAPLAQRYRAVYVGVDFSLSMIDQALARTAAEPGEQRFAVGAGDALSFRDSSFDLVVAVGYIEYFEDPARTLEELRRVLSAGGVLVIQSFKWDLLGRTRRSLERMVGGDEKPDHRLPEDWVDRKYSPRELDALVGRFGFEKIGSTFNNFYLLPEVARRRWPKLYMSMSEAVGRLAPHVLGFSAVNYVGKYALRKAP